MRALVHVKLKEAVPDPEGREVAERLQHFGYAEIKDVRFGRTIELEFDAGDRGNAEERVKKICEELLINPVTEEFKILAIE